MTSETEHTYARALAVAVAIFACALAAAGCAIDASDPSSATADADVVVTPGPDGQTFATEDGAISVQVPTVNALEAPVTIRQLGLTDQPQDLVDIGATGVVYELGPADTAFVEPVSVTRRIPIDDFGWAAERGVPVLLLATTRPDGDGWEYLRDQRARLDGDTVAVTGDMSHFSPIVIIGLPAQARLISDAATAGVAVGGSVPVPTATDVRLYGPDAMHESILNTWEDLSEEGVLRIDGGGSGSTVDDFLLDALVKEYESALDDGAINSAAEVPGDVFTSDLVPALTRSAFQESLVTGDPAAWTAGSDGVVSCTAPDEATTSLAVDGTGIVRPLLLGLEDQSLPGLEGDVPAFSFIVDYSVSCTADEPVATSGVPSISGACLSWSTVNARNRDVDPVRLVLTVRIDGLDARPSRTTFAVPVKGLRADRRLDMAYRRAAGVWRATAVVDEPGDVVITDAILQLRDGTEFGLGEELLRRLGTVDLADEASGQQGDLCNE